MTMPPSPFLLGLKNLGQFLGKKLDVLTTAVKELKPEKADDSGTRLIVAGLARLEKELKKVQNPKFTGKVTLDGAAFAKEIRGVAKEIGDLAKKMEPTDVSKVERELATLNRNLQGQSNANVYKAIQELISVMKATVRDPKKPQTFRLEDMQLRQLSRGGGGTTVVNSGPLAARGVRNTQVAMTSADTEYSYTFPSNTLAWRMKLRAQDAKFTYSWTSGTLPGGAGTDAYLTVPENFLDSRDGVEFSGKTIYFQSDQASQVMEIEVYTAS